MLGLIPEKYRKVFLSRIDFLLTITKLPFEHIYTVNY